MSTTPGATVPTNEPAAHLTADRALALLTELETLLGRYDANTSPVRGAASVRVRTAWGELTLATNTIPVYVGGEPVLDWTLDAGYFRGIWSGSVAVDGTVHIVATSITDTVEEDRLRRSVAHHTRKHLPPGTFAAKVRQLEDNHLCGLVHRSSAQIAKVADAARGLHVAAMRRAVRDLPAEQRALADRLINAGFPGTAAELAATVAAAAGQDVA